MPEDELRSFAAEAKLAHEDAIDNMLAEMRAENDALEAAVAVQDARARKVTSTLRAREGDVAAIVAPAARLAQSSAADAADDR